MVQQTTPAQPRLILYFEDHVTDDGRVLRDTRFTDEPIPLLLMPDDTNGLGHAGSMLIGAVHSLRRDMAHLAHWTWKPVVSGIPSIDLSPYLGYAPEPDFDNGDSRLEDRGLMVLEGARLRSITFGQRPCWPGLVLTR